MVNYDLGRLVTHIERLHVVLNHAAQLDPGFC